MKEPLGLRKYLNDTAVSKENRSTTRIIVGPEVKVIQLWKGLMVNSAQFSKFFIYKSTKIQTFNLQVVKRRTVP